MHRAVVTTLICSTILVLCSCSTSDQVIAPGHFTLLPPGLASRMLDQCSRPTPKSDEMWKLADADIAQLERDLPHLAHMKARSCCFLGARIEGVGSTLRQYVGVIVGGRRLIYINGFPASMAKEQPDWKEQVVMICDGGPDFWGALYDPVSRKFSDLAFNGVA